MKGIKTKNGITLVSLIITVVVLLILATISIGGMQGTNIIKEAGKTKKEYEESQSKLENIQSYYSNYLSE